MRSQNISRKNFLLNSAWTVASLTLGAHVLAASKTNKNTSKLVLKNVKLETGFTYDFEEVVGTKTDLFLVEIEDGKIVKIDKNDPTAQAVDCKEYIMLPSFRDMHIHLDKTIYSDHWQSVRRRTNGVKGMIELEQKIMPDLLKTSTKKAERLIELLQSNGTAFARSHVNIEPTSKLQSLYNLQKALENKSASFASELVAFPQHGVFYTDTAPYLKDAAQMDIDFIGGLDPFSIDGSIERPIDFTVQLALDYDKGIDIHLHESGLSGLNTVEYLIEKVLENPSLKNKTYVSHCFVLGQIEKVKQEEIAEKLAAAGIGIVSTIPIGPRSMPIPVLYKHGVKVMTGNDSIVDHWSTFGTGSVLQKANLVAQLYGYSNELGLSRCLRIATDDVLPLDDQGKQQWPRVGDQANLVFLEASCSAEAVARVSPVKSLIVDGKIVY